jgi:thiamine biosynthesis lipoprotein
MILNKIDFYAMGSPCCLQLYSTEKVQTQQIAKKVINEIKRLEKTYSRYLENSLISKVNNSAGSKKSILVDLETATLLDYADTCYQQSEGLFDITAGVLRRIWNFQNIDCKSTDRLPSQESITNLLPLIGWNKIIWKKPYLTLPLKGMEIDFGGIVKEYAVDTASGLCRQYGIKHGIIELGGDIGIIGTHPDNKEWQIGIRHSKNNKNLLANLAIKNGAVASSGNYERYIEIDGKRYSHIINPHTGLPNLQSLKAVSVVAEHCVIAGSVATIAILKGENGLNWLKQSGLSYVYKP